MAAVRQEGFDLWAKVNYSEIIKANDATDKFVSKVSELNQTLRGTKVPTNIDNDFIRIKGSASNASDAVKKYASDLRSTGDASRAATNQVTESMHSSSASIKETRTQANLLKGTYEKQASSASTLGSKTQEITNKQVDLKNKTNDTKGSFDKLRDSGSKLASVGSVIVAGLIPVGIAFKDAAKQAENLQDRYLTVKNLLNTGGESASAARLETSQMQKSNRRLSDTYGITQSELGKGSEELIRRGYSGKQANAANADYLKASIASKDSYSDVVNYGAPVLEQFGYKTKAGNNDRLMSKYTKRVLNQMAYAADLSATDFSGIGEAMKYAGSAAHSSGHGLSETLAAVGTLSNNGLDGSVAGTSLRRVMNVLSAPNKKQASQLGTIGLNPADFVDKNGHAKSLQQDFALINKGVKAKHLSQNDRTALFSRLFGQYGQSAATILADNNNQTANLTKDIKGAENYNHGKGYDESLAKKNMDSFDRQFKVFQNRAKNIFGDVVNNVLPTITNLLKGVNGFLNGYKKLPKGVKNTIGGSLGAAGTFATGWLGMKLVKQAGKTFLGLGGSSAAKGTSEVSLLSRAKNLFTQTSPNGTNIYTAGLFQSARSAGGFKGLTTAGKIGTGLAGAGVAIDAGTTIVKALKSKKNTTKYKGVGSGIGKAIGGGIGLYFGGPLGAAVGTKIGDVVGSWGGKSVLKFQKGWNSKKPPKKFWSLENLGWSAHSMFDGFKSGVGSVIQWFKDKWQGLTSWFDKTKKNLSSFGHSIDLTDKHSNIRKGLSSIIGSHALGSHGGASHYALVGEAGTEIGYRINGNHARLLGANGPEIVKVHAGENILPAGPSSKILNGGLGQGMILPGYANGKGVTNISGNASLGGLSKSNKRVWAEISSDTKKQTTKTRKAAIKDYSTMKKGVHSNMAALKSGVVDLAEATSKGFGKALDKMDNYAHSAMKSTINQMNNGISGIDKTLSQFGGNTSVIKPIKFAAGSNGRLGHDQWAMINDATTGPRQEGIVRNNQLFVPHGDNRIIHAQAGDEILNGSQLQEIVNMRDLTHFAKGSGVSHSRLREIAKMGAANPAKSFADSFTKHVKANKSAVQRGTTQLGKNASSEFGIPWMRAIWQVIKDKFSSGKGGTREAFLNYAESHYSGKPYQMGATGPTAYDCSGMVSSALEHFGINIGRTTVAMQNSSGVQYLGKNLAKTEPGDIVVFGHGTGAAGHVGIIKNPASGSMFNETPPRARVTSIADDKGMGYGYYRVKGLHNAAVKRGNSRLEKLAKKELGSKALSWISKNLGEDSLLGSFAIGGDVADRARALAKAFKSADPNATKNGIAAIIGNWSFESGLNPGVTNSIGATELGQWLGGRAANLKNYAKKHGQSWKSAAAQLNFALHGDGSDAATLRSILEGKGSVSSLASKFSTLWERGGYTSQHVAGAENVAKILGYANGGDPPVNQEVMVGEYGPERVKFKQPVHVYDHDKLFDRPKMVKPKQQAQRPVINVNFNAPIYAADKAGLKSMIEKYVKLAINSVLENAADEFGLDQSIY